MSRRRGALFLPLEVTFMDDDKVVEAGEKASWLFLAVMLKAKELGTDGHLTTAQIGRLGITSWQPRLRTCINAGLLLETDKGVAIPSWLNHNDPNDIIAARRAEDADRKRRTRNTPSERSPNGHDADIRPESVRREEKRREENKPPNPPAPPGGQTIHDGQHPNCRQCATNPRGRRTDIFAHLEEAQ